MIEYFIELAYHFTGYLISRVGIKRIRRIYLYGSVASGRIRKESDVDIFIDGDEEIEEEVYKILDDFYETIYYKNISTIIGKRKISLIVGDLERFKELKEAILGNSILIFSRTIPEDIQPRYLIYWEKIGEKKKIVSLRRKFFGYKYKGKYYKPRILVERIGKSCILVKREDLDDVVRELSNLGVRFKIKRIFVEK